MIVSQDLARGTNCQTHMDECSSMPCRNRGVCTDAIDGFNCTCATGYEGSTCEIETDECMSNPCQNDGVCLDEVGRLGIPVNVGMHSVV